MVRNYFKNAWRSLLKNKLFSSINIFGLAVGLASVIFIFIWIQNELNYDKYHLNASQTYRVTREFLNADGSTNIHLAAIALPFEPLLEKNFPEIEKATRFMQDRAVIRYGEKKFREDKVCWAEGNFFDVFTYKFIEGDPRTALKEPNTVVITKQMAKKYFNDQNPLNQTLYYGAILMPLKVTAVMENVPGNSHFHFDFLISFITTQQYFNRDDYTNNWGGNNFFTYLLLKENTDPQKLEAKFPGFLDRVMPVNESVTGSKGNKLHLQKISDIHLYSHLMDEAEPTGSMKYVYIFGCIALFILLIACINYMNLTTARAFNRLKEVGVRKVIGANRRQLFAQFFTESAVITIIGLFLSLLVIYILLPVFENFNNTVYSFSPRQAFFLIAGIVVLLSLTIFLAGSYPSLYISGFKPISIIKNKLQDARSHFSFRKVLVVFQFAISITLIVAVLVIRRQINFMQNKDLGFNKNWVIALPVNDSIINQFETVKNILLQNPGIKNASFSSRIPSGQLLDAQDARMEINGNMQQLNFRLSCIFTDFDYIKTFGMKIVAGRDFSKELPTDSVNAFIVNEAAVRTAGWKSDEDAINKKIQYGGRNGRIVGVVKDFNFESLHKPILPIVFYIQPGPRRVFSVRFSGDHLPATIDYVKNVWQRFAPNMVFSYSFLDERLQDLYQAEQKLNVIYILFASVAIFIASLGLFGLATFMAQQRIREIGIRKVLGASVTSIASLLSVDFLKLVMISLLIAVPVGWWAMNKWLESFAFHISINWKIFLAAGLIAIFIALITISYQAIKAAIANPVKSLRTE